MKSQIAHGTAHVISMRSQSCKTNNYSAAFLLVPQIFDRCFDDGDTISDAYNGTAKFEDFLTGAVKTTLLSPFCQILRGVFFLGMAGRHGIVLRIVLVPGDQRLRSAALV